MKRRIRHRGLPVKAVAFVRCNSMRREAVFDMKKISTACPPQDTTLKLTSSRSEVCVPRAEVEGLYVCKNFTPEYSKRPNKLHAMKTRRTARPKNKISMPRASLFPSIWILGSILPHFGNLGKKESEERPRWLSYRYTHSGHRFLDLGARMISSPFGEVLFNEQVVRAWFSLLFACVSMSEN